MDDRDRSAQADPSAVATDALGSELAQRTVTARPEGFGQLVDWGRKLDASDLDSERARIG